MAYSVILNYNSIKLQKNFKKYTKKEQLSKLW